MINTRHAIMRTDIDSKLDSITGAIENTGCHIKVTYTIKTNGNIRVFTTSSFDVGGSYLASGTTIVADGSEVLLGPSNHVVSVGIDGSTDGTTIFPNNSFVNIVIIDEDTNEELFVDQLTRNHSSTPC